MKNSRPGRTRFFRLFRQLPAGVVFFFGVVLVLAGCRTLGPPETGPEPPAVPEGAVQIPAPPKTDTPPAPEPGTPEDAPPEDPAFFPAPSWEPLDDGLWFYSYTDKSLPLAIFAVKAELAPGGTPEENRRSRWEVVLTPPGNSEKWIMEGMKVSRFAEEYRCSVAVNGGPFSPYRYFFSGQGQDPAGLLVWKGEVLAGPRKDFAALVVRQDGRAEILLQREVPEDAFYALGGFQKLLTAGRPEELPDSPQTARTLLGLSEDRGFIILAVADGGRGNYSAGLTLEESARWLRTLGAWEGMNLDGGGSSVMVFWDEAAGASEVNRNSNRRGFGERIVATHVGLKKISENENEED